MRISLKKIADKLIWVLTVFILTTYILFETYAWGRYAYFGASVAIVLLSAFLNKGCIRFRFVPLYGFMLLFAGFCAISALWALNAEDAIIKATTICMILGCNMMLYVHYQHGDRILSLLEAVKWSGYFVSIYTILFYGMDVLLLSAQLKRIGNTFSNVNTIGMLAATSCTIQMHEWLYKEHRKAAFFMIPCVIVIAASQSRKAVILLMLGVFLVFFMKRQYGRNSLRRFGKTIAVLTAILVILAILYSLPIFDGARKRMNQMFAGLFGSGKADNSTIVRNRMIDLGLEWFKRYPVGGIGIGNAHILASGYIGMDAYLHNNFVEMLCSGGIAGFVVYYSIYIYLLANLVKYRKIDRRSFEMCFAWMILLIVMDYGAVSYYSKSHWFYLMIQFLNVENMKRKSRRMQREIQTSFE